MKKVWWVIIAVVLLVFLFLVGGKIAGVDRDKASSEEKPVITSNFVDPTKIAAITKFRSCEGHIVVPQDGSEPRSNMKHYFYLKKEYTSSRRQVELYAPFDGYVSDIYDGDKDFSDRDPSSRDLTVSRKKGFTSRSDWGFTFLHIEPRDDLKEGDTVMAGELVGYVALEVIPPYYAFDVVYGKYGTFPKKIDNWMSPYKALESAFSYMDKGVLAEYEQVFGVGRSEDFIIERSVRAAAPCVYGEDGRRFENKHDESWRSDYIGNVRDAAN